MLNPALFGAIDTACKAITNLVKRSQLPSSATFGYEGQVNVQGEKTIGEFVLSHPNNIQFPEISSIVSFNEANATSWDAPLQNVVSSGWRNGTLVPWWVMST
jgi:fructose-1,6-bisphosphatase